MKKLGVNKVFCPKSQKWSLIFSNGFRLEEGKKYIKHSLFTVLILDLTEHTHIHYTLLCFKCGKLLRDFFTLRAICKENTKEFRCGHCLTNFPELHGITALEKILIYHSRAMGNLGNVIEHSMRHTLLVCQT